MPNTLSLEEMIEDLEMNDADLYTRGLPLPNGERAMHTMDEALRYIQYDLEIPLDMAAQMMIEGIHVDDFVSYVQDHMVVESGYAVH